MGFCVYFHRTWTPGYNSEVIDPNLAYSYQKKLDFVKRVAWWVFILTLIISVIILLAKLSSCSSSEDGQCGTTITPSPSPISHQRLLRTPDQPDVEDEEIESFSNNATIICPLGQFRCQRSGNCVPISAFCDGVYDCGYDDYSDEPEKDKCTCQHYLELAAPETKTMCDPSGESRCPDRSDQLGCPCRSDSFVCDQKASEPKECIHQNLVCDSVKDCSNGQDESFCTAVSSSLTNLLMERINDTLSGFVLVRVKGSWHPYCSNRWSPEMGEKICRFLGYNVLVNDLDKHKPSSNAGYYDSNEDGPHLWFLKNNTSIDTGPIEDVIVKINNSESYNCNVAYIKCSKS